MGPTLPMLLLSLIIAVCALLKYTSPKMLAKYGYVLSSNKLEVEENLPEFYSALKMKDKEWFVSENERMKNQYAYMVANSGTLKRIKRYQSTPARPITNIAFYWLLANPEYQRQFNYIPVAVKNRNDLIVDENRDDKETNCE